MNGLSQKCCHVWLDQNFDPSLLACFHEKEAKKFFLKKKIKMSDSKKLSFSKSYDPSEITTVGMIEPVLIIGI